METTTPPSLLGDLETAIQNGSREKRIVMLRRIADLFVDTAPRITEAQTGLFDDVFEQLTREIETKAMRELSERMADVDNAPERLIRRLANDDSIQVSGPVLARSGRLDEEDILEIARTNNVPALTPQKFAEMFVDENLTL